MNQSFRVHDTVKYTSQFYFPACRTGVVWRCLTTRLITFLFWECKLGSNYVSRPELTNTYLIFVFKWLLFYTMILTKPLICFAKQIKAYVCLYKFLKCFAVSLYEPPTIEFERTFLNLLNCANFFSRFFKQKLRKTTNIERTTKFSCVSPQILQKLVVW